VSEDTHEKQRGGGCARTAPPAARAPDPQKTRGESRLVQALQAGEGSAFEELVRRHGPNLLAVARGIVRNDEDARDCVQEAFLSAYRSIARFEGRASLGTWLHRIVTNASLMKLRSHGRRPEVSIDPLLSHFDEYGFLEGPIHSNSASAEELLQRADTRKMVRGAIDQLPESYRTILVLRDIEGYSTDEVVELLEISRGAAKVRLHRARTALKNLIGSVFE